MTKLERAKYNRRLAQVLLDQALQNTALKCDVKAALQCLAASSKEGESRKVVSSRQPFSGERKYNVR